MKTILFILAVIVLSSCAILRRNPLTADKGVEINGITWATRNVGETSQTFVSKPQYFGGHFTWNEAQLACPEGWRLPAHEELQSLMHSGSAWATLDGVNGSVFGTAPSQIFLPAAGWRDSYDGALNHTGTEAGYWSSTQSSDENAQHLWFFRGSTGTGWANRAHGFSVRCVK